MASNVLSPIPDRLVYRDRYALWFMRAQAICVFALALILATASPEHALIAEPELFAVRVIGSVIVVLSVLWLGHGIRRFTLEATPQGATVGVLHRRFIPWSKVKRFTAVHRAGFYPVVYMELTSGELCWARLVQGRKMFWNGGASKDIVGVLNVELALSHGARTAAASIA
jgi:hypothetical protein